VEAWGAWEAWEALEEPEALRTVSAWRLATLEVIGTKEAQAAPQALEAWAAWEALE
jgi:hypothetical protein